MEKIRLLGLLVLFATFIACNKEDDQTKAVNVEVWGYNLGDTELEAVIDTSVYRNSIIAPNKPITFSKIYTFPAGKKEAPLIIKDKTSGNPILQQQLSIGGSELELFLPFVYINGNVLETKPPPVDATTNKLGFYIYYPQSEEALDIFMKNGEEQIVYIAQNVKPGAWINVNYVPEKGYKPVNLFFTKTGTTDSWYFNDNEAQSKSGQSGLLLPEDGEKGLVRTYFITPSAFQLEAIRLFKRPKVQ
jgi:hypothetical protein